MSVDETSLLGVPKGLLGEVIGPLLPGRDRQLAEHHELLEDLCARLIWSQLVEPGDVLAGQLIAELGAAQSLRLLRGGHQSPQERLWRELALRDSSLAAEGQEAKTIAVIRESAERWLQRDNNAKLLRDLKTWRQLSGWVIGPSSSLWPETLHDLGFAAPICLWGRGSAETLERLSQSVAIVGSRNTTTYGSWITRELATRLAEDGFCIVSGGAYGIDAFAHEAVVVLAESQLETPRDAASCPALSTVAVMAGGADRLYPIGNTKLLTQVMNHGCVISELPPGNAPTKWRFLQRNRLIAALGQAVVVVEMAYRSGALNTVHHALEIGRRVIAVPGSILSPTSQGCNQVIQEGKAEPATSFDQLLQLAKGELGEVENSPKLSATQSRVLDFVSNQLKSVSAIAQLSGTGQTETQGTLAELELLGYVCRQNGKWKRTESARISGA